MIRPLHLVYHGGAGACPLLMAEPALIPLRRTIRVLLALAALAAGSGCRREDLRVRELTRRASQTEDGIRQLRAAWEEQQDQFRLAGLVHPRPVLLSAEQKKALEGRVNREQDVSRRGLLREILAKDREIAALEASLAGLRAGLPRPEVAESNDSHYGMAMRFLRAQGVPEARARSLVGRVLLLARLAPGFEVYHFYVGGTYGTWVAQGQAAVTPGELNGAGDPLQGRRGQPAPVPRSLRMRLAGLEQRKREIDKQIAAIQAERSSAEREHTALLEGYAHLQHDNARQLAELNSLHYLVGVREVLKQEGIIEAPLLGQDRPGRNWWNPFFRQSLDLRGGNRITIRAADLGLKRIGRVRVVPDSFIRDAHYRLSVSPDGLAATVELLELSRFRNDKVAFAVTE